jgi:hypothetical protein
MWMAMWMKPAAVMVALGTSGSVELQQAEDLTWWIGEMAVDSGDTTTATNGNMYMLTYDMDSGMWSSAFMPATMEIMGTGLMAMSREADMKPAAVMVALGTSGSVELQQAEDLSWWIGEMAFDSGHVRCRRERGHDTGVRHGPAWAT